MTTWVTISDMPAAASLDGSELFPVVQGGVNKRATVSQISVNTSSLTGVLTAANGGTGTNLTPTLGAVLVGTGAAYEPSVLTAGTGVGITNVGSVLTVTNSAPDQTVSLTAGTGVSVSGTYPDFTVTNSAPDQTVSLTAGTGVSVTGTYPDFTVTNSAPDQTVSLTGAGTVAVTGTYPDFTVTGSGGGNTLEASVTKPVIANFTLENSGGVATITDGSYGIVLDSVSSGGANIRFVRTNSAVGSTWTMTMRTASHTALNGTGYSCAMIARNSSNGRLLISGIYNNSNQYVIQRWSSYAAYSGNVMAPVSVPAASWYWWRMVNDGTNITYWMSADGYTWSTFRTEALASFITAAGGSVDQVGFGMMVGDSIMLDTCQSFTLT